MNGDEQMQTHDRGGIKNMLMRMEKMYTCWGGTYYDYSIWYRRPQIKNLWNSISGSSGKTMNCIQECKSKTIKDCVYIGKSLSIIRDTVWTSYNTDWWRDSRSQIRSETEYADITMKDNTMVLVTRWTANWYHEILFHTFCAQVGALCDALIAFVSSVYALED